MIPTMVAGVDDILNILHHIKTVNQNRIGSLLSTPPCSFHHPSSLSLLFKAKLMIIGSTTLRSLPTPTLVLNPNYLRYFRLDSLALRKRPACACMKNHNRPGAVYLIIHPGV